MGSYVSLDHAKSDGRLDHGNIDIRRRLNRIRFGDLRATQFGEVEETGLRARTRNFAQPDVHRHGPRWPARRLCPSLVNLTPRLLESLNGNHSLMGAEALRVSRAVVGVNEPRFAGVGVCRPTTQVVAELAQQDRRDGHVCQPRYGSRHEAKGARDDAADWLRELLADGRCGTLPSGEVVALEPELTTGHLRLRISAPDGSQIDHCQVEGEDSPTNRPSSRTGTTLFVDD
jgi:hypothetical protein